MTEAFAELPLAIFTTLATIGVGAYVTLAVAYVSGKFSSEEYKKLAFFSIVPLAFMVVGVIASFLHLASPLNAMNVFSTIGSTPMANEIITLVIFGVLAAVYWLAGGFANLSEGLHKGWMVLLAVAGVVSCWMIGQAYALPTIPGWDTLFTPISLLGFGLFGGSIVAMIPLALAGVADNVTDGDFANRAVGINVLGFVLAVAGVIGICVAVSGVTGTLLDAGAAVSAMMPFVVISIILMVFGVCGSFATIKVMPWTSIAIIVTVIIVIAVFLARFAFYGMQIGIGL